MPQHDIINKITWGPSEDTDQSAQSESLLCASWIAKDPWFLHLDSKDSVKTGRMHRLI